MSSTSDADNGAEETPQAQGDGENNSLETGAEISKTDGNAAADAQRLEIFKVKKDLINSFNNQPKECHSSPSRIGSHTTRNNNLYKSAAASMVHTNAELSDTSNVETIKGSKQEDNLSFPLTANSGETIVNTAGIVATSLSPTEIKEPVVEETLLDKQEEHLQSKSIVPVKISTPDSQILSQTQEKMDEKLENPSTDTNNNSSATEETETFQNNSSPAKAYCSFDSTSPRKLSDNIYDSSLISNVSQITENFVSDRSIDCHNLTYALPLELPCSDSSFSDTEDNSMSKEGSKLQLEPISVDKIHHVSDNTGSPQENINKVHLSAENPSTMMSQISSLVIPVNVQSSLQKEFSSFQEAVILKSPSKTNKNVPSMHATFTPTASTLAQEITRDNSCTPKTKDSDSLDLLMSPNKVSGSDSPFGLPPHHPSPSNISQESHTPRLLELQSEPQTDTREKRSIVSFNTADNIESIIPIATFHCFNEHTLNNKENNFLNVTIVNSLSSNAKTSNVSTPLFNTVNSANFRKRSVGEADALDEKSVERHTSQSEKSDSPKKIRLNPASSLQSTSHQDSGHANETLMQYVATKFRPIAPKNMSIHGVDHGEVNALQQNGNVQQLPLKQLPEKNNVFVSMSISSEKSNMKIDKEHISTSNLNKSIFSDKVEQGPVLNQSGNAKSFSIRGSKVDDILTTVLKSSIPLDKSLFEAGWLNTSRLNKHVSETPNKYQNEHLNQRPLHVMLANQESRCQSNHKSKSPTQRSTFTDQTFTTSFLNQTCEADKTERAVSQLMDLVGDNNVLLEPPATQAHYNVSALLRELCHRCKLSDGDSKNDISEALKDVSVAYKKDSTAESLQNQPSVFSLYNGDREMKTESSNSSPIDLTVNQQRPLGILLDENEIGKLHFSSTQSSQNKPTASEKDRTSAKNEQYALDKGFHFSGKHSSMTNIVHNMSDSSFTQPLNLSLRGHNKETKRPKTPRLQDKESTDRDNSPGLDLSLRRCITSPESTLNYFPNRSPSQTSSQSDSENDSPTMKSYKRSDFQGDNRSHCKGAYQTNVMDSNSMPTLFSPVGFLRTEQHNNSKASPEKYPSLYHRTSSEYKAYLAAETDTVSRHTSIFSGKLDQQHELENVNKNINYIQKTSVRSDGCLPGLNQNYHLLPEPGMITMLPSMLHGYHNPGEAAGTGDDVWRPW